MSEKPESPIDQMREWAQNAPPVDGARPSETVLSEISNTRVVAILLTDKGQVYHLSNIELGGVNLARLEQPRTALNELMDSYGIKDGPNWSAVKD